MLFAAHLTQRKSDPQGTITSLVETRIFQHGIAIRNFIFFMPLTVLLKKSPANIAGSALFSYLCLQREQTTSQPKKPSETAEATFEKMREISRCHRERLTALLPINQLRALCRKAGWVAGENAVSYCWHKVRDKLIDVELESRVEQPPTFWICMIAQMV